MHTSIEMMLKSNVWDSNPRTLRDEILSLAALTASRTFVLRHIAYMYDIYVFLILF